MYQGNSRKVMAIFIALLLLALPACGTKEASDAPQSAASSAAQSADLSGTVSAIRADSITVAAEDGTETTVPLTDATVFTRQGMGGGNGQPPAMPDGEQPADGGQAPAMPDGEQPADMGQAPDGMGGGRAETLTYESVQVGDSVSITLADDGSAATVALMGGMGGMGGGMGASQPESYQSANSYTDSASLTDASLSSTGVDENAVYLGSSGVTVSLDNATIDRTSAESTGGDSSSFYGVGAAALVTDGLLDIANSTITTDAKGGAGVFAYGNGTAYVSNSTITTAQDTSGGIHVAGGGTLYAWDLTVQTAGESSAAIRSDRGSGRMVVDGGSYTSNGAGSPAVYSTADITVNNATLTATGSEAICIEGLNTIRLFDCDLSGNMSDLSQNDCTWNVILYQSMSGDSQVGNSTFEMVGGTLTAQNGGMFYTTNTESTFLLSGVTINNAADSEFLLKCTGNNNQRGWGSAGANGADCHFTAIDQLLEGDVIWDSISKLDCYLTQNSTLTGAVRNDESCAGEGGDGYAALYLDQTSRWVVTADSSLTSLDCAGTVTDSDGNTVTIRGTDGTVYVEGSSPYTVTVERYSTTPDLSAASAADSWDNYAVAR